ncbi:MAG: outer membrane porin GjpA, partial [Actinomycetia bacterium]|nr:outer membrane porin GjpA [Actinomycetes bacterium]
MDIRTNIRTKIPVRSYLTAGVAALGAGAIVMAPVQPLPERSTLTPALSSSLAVDLAASIDPITPWIETFQTATVNIERIITAATSTPLPIITQVITNFGTYLAELPDIGAILGQVVGNVGNALGAPFAVPTSCSDLEQGPCESISTATVVAGIPFLDTLNQQQVFALLPAILPAEQYASLKPVLDFTTSPISGVLLGAIGPVVAPVISVVNSLGAIVDALGQSDFEGAINELINIPANAVNAFLNGGQFLDLAPVLSLVGVTLPDSITNLGFNMPGILSTGISPVPPAEGADADPVAGVMFDGLAFTA